MLVFFSRVAKNPFSISVLERLVSLFSKALIYILVSRLLGPEAQGICGLYNSYSSIAAVFFIFGLDVANTFFTSKSTDSEYITSLISNSILYCLFTIIISTIVLYFSSSLLDVLKFPAALFNLMLINVNVTLIRQLFRGFIYGKSYFLEQFIGVFISDFLLLIVVLFLIGVNQFNLDTFLIIQLCFFILSLTYWLMILFSKEKFKFNSSFSIFKKTLQYALKVFLSNILISFNLRLNVFLVAYFMTIEYLGYYTIAITISEIVLNIPLSITNVILNQNTKNSKHDLRIFGIINFLMIILIFLISASSIYLIPFFYGSDFIESVYPLIILLFASFFLSIGSILSYMMMSENKSHFILFSSIPTLLCTFIFSFFLIPKLGLVGASLSSLFSFFIFFIFQFYYAIRNLKIKGLLFSLIPAPRRTFFILRNFVK
jgi:O-antigen/teichoic acid export membrane protein